MRCMHAARPRAQVRVVDKRLLCHIRAARSSAKPFRLRQCQRRVTSGRCVQLSWVGVCALHRPRIGGDRRQSRASSFAASAAVHPSNWGPGSITGHFKKRNSPLRTTRLILGDRFPKLEIACQGLKPALRAKHRFFS